MHARSIESYIDEELLRVDDQHESRIDQIKFNANEAYDSIKSVTFDMTPIAIAQEPSAFTARMLEITHKQMRSQGIQPFSVALSANYPDIDEPRYIRNRKRNLATIRAFQESAAGQQLPLSFYEQSYDPGTTIGKIRRDLAHVSLQGMRMQHRRAPIPLHANVLITDVDTWHYSQGYLPRQQSALEQGYSWACANKRYLTSNGKFPNLDRAVHGLNMACLFSPRGTYDCHSMYSVETLVNGDCFDENDTISETHRMRDRAVEKMDRYFREPNPRQQPGAIAVSYPRRPFEKFRNGIPHYEFWKENEFTMQDEYREGIVGDEQDISLELSNYFLATSISSITGYVRDAMIQAILEEQGDVAYHAIRPIVDEHVANLLRKADVILDLQLNKLSMLDSVTRPTI